MNTVAPVQTEPGSAKRLWLRVLLGLALILVMVATGATYLIFSSWQEIPVIAADFKDFGVQYRLFDRMSKELSKSKKDLNRKTTLKLSPQEINSLFRIFANVKPGNSPYPIRYYQCSFSDDGVFSTVIPVKTSQEWLWGGTIYVKVSFTLSKSEGKDLQCRIVSCKLTSLPVSRDAAQKIADRMMAEKKVQDQLKAVNSILRSLSFQNGKLCIEYLPQKIMSLQQR